jgi:hypothetical protein
MARSSNARPAPSIGRIQKRKTNLLQIIIFGLQRAAGPYRWAIRLLMRFDLRRLSPALARSQWLDRDVNPLHQFGERVVVKRQGQLPGLDLREVEDVID